MPALKTYLIRNFQELAWKNVIIAEDHSQSFMIAYEEGDPYADNYYKFVMRCIEKYNPNVKAILELAVGTGKLL
jgi:hypothetical protein